MRRPSRYSARTQQDMTLVCAVGNDDVPKVLGDENVSSPQPKVLDNRPAVAL